MKTNPLSESPSFHPSNDRLVVVMRPTLACNQRCRYCYISADAKASIAKMERRVLDGACRLIQESGYSSVSMSWQGGEPLLLGPSGLKAYLAYSTRQLEKAGISCWHSIHTNGSLLDTGFTAVFLDFGVSVGVSIDGYYEVHSKYRSMPGEEVAFRSMLNSIDRLVDAGVNVEVTATLASPESLDVDRLYQFFRSLRVARINVEPCLAYSPDFICHSGSLWFSPYVDVMAHLHERWSADSEAGRPPIAYFAEITSILRGGRPESCHLAGDCSNHITIGPTGDVFPCDHFAGFPRFRLGNVAERPIVSLETMQRASGEMSTIAAARHGCDGCKWLRACNGGCPYQRLSESVAANYATQCERARLFEVVALRL